MGMSKIIFGSAIALVLIAGYVALRPSGVGQRVNRKHFEAIEEGMSLQDLEKLLGVPAGNYSRRLASGPKAFIKKLGEDMREENHALWVSDQGIIVVFFDDGQKVDAAIFRTAHLDPNYTYLDRFRSLLHLQLISPFSAHPPGTHRAAR
jgi:hypothetical protein